MKKLILKEGTKFGKWTVMNSIGERKNNLSQWVCECECGVMQTVPLNNLMNGSSTQCINCAAKENGLKKRGGAGNISGDMWSQFIYKATRKGDVVTLNVDDAWNLFKKQKEKCAISNLDIQLSGYPYDREKTTAALVKIDMNKPFTLDNSMWIHKDIAKMKSDLSLEKFLYYVEKISHR